MTLSAGIVPILYTLMSELFPTEIRTQAIGITEALYLASEGVGVKLFPEMKNSMGLCGVCLLYASMGYLNVFWGGLTIPDNRGTYFKKFCFLLIRIIFLNTHLCRCKPSLLIKRNNVD